jgi:hypothetical protein
MIQLHDNDNCTWIVTITESNLQYLIDQLEEESREDKDYYINKTTLDIFEERGADKALITLLRGALNGRTEMEIRWSQS